MDVKALTYPTYETRGSLEDAVDKFLTWLTTEVATLESAPLLSAASTRRKRHCGVVLCGHSMGGLVTLDASLSIHSQASDHQPAWPHICGVLAYDTPYLGVHPNVFKHQLSTYHGYLDNVIKVGAMLAPVTGGMASMLASRRASPNVSHKSRWSTASWIGIGTAAAAAIGTAAVAAYTSSDPVQDTYRWVSEHVMFVRHLWDTEALTLRLHSCRVPYHCFYTQLRGTNPRTFIIVPDAHKPYARAFTPIIIPAANEVAAHIGMFSMRTNPAYSSMGLDSAALIGEWVPRLSSAPSISTPAWTDEVPMEEDSTH